MGLLTYMETEGSFARGEKVNYSTEVLRKFYRKMLGIRLCEEGLVEPILNREIQTPCHLYSGQEAIAVGLSTCLKDEDYVFGNHRSHGHFLAMGGSARDLLAEVYCKGDGCSRGRGGSMHVCNPAQGMLGSAPIVGGTISLAVGAALASKIMGDGRVTVSFFGDGATGEGVLYESMNFAALMKLSVIFACENNFYSTHMPILECRVNNDIFKIAEPFCIESHQVDGNDVIQVYEISKQAVDKCRRGRGPVFIEFQTYRMRGHVGPDDNVQGSHTDIRPKQEIEQWRQRDPIRRFERYLTREGLLTEAQLTKIREEVEKEVEGAHRIAKNSASPDQKELMKYVFCEETRI